MAEKVILLVEDNSADIELTLHAFKKEQNSKSGSCCARW